MKRLLLPLALAVTASPAVAHLDPGTHGSFVAGMSHPAFGLDHVLAIVAVGLWAGMMAGRARWAVPSAFVALMVLGFGLSVAGLPLPLVEPMIVASVVVVGLLVAAAVRLDPRLATALVGLFAVFHGHAHGSELGQAGALGFGLGFLIATAALQGAGIALALLAERAAEKLGGVAPGLVRGAGGLTALAGIGLLVS
ncbi:HupE/UreJ family protein [Defluviimonas sp. SAOS-178_SWC]|uniref:HupE/UreJ family protein n=1 Tax=Defluviimonas sp. SAOS-178_SWC TaxID=3121287 RepID=UPI003221EF35